MAEVFWGEDSLKSMRRNFLRDFEAEISYESPEEPFKESRIYFGFFRCIFGMLFFSVA